MDDVILQAIREALKSSRMVAQGITFSDGIAGYQDSSGTHIRFDAVPAGVLTFQGYRMITSGTVSVPGTGAFTALNITDGTPVYNTGLFVNTSVTVITINATGYYRGCAQILLNTAASSFWDVQITIGGNLIAEDRRPLPSNGGAISNIPWECHINSGDTMGITAKQTTGGALNAEVNVWAFSQIG